MQNGINLFEDNLIANKKEVGYEEIYNGLMTYKMFTKSYPEKITFENCLILYLSNADGLNSTFDSDGFESLKNYCYGKFREGIKSLSHERI